MSDPLDRHTASLTARDAYNALCHFLNARYERAPSDELGELLGALALDLDGTSADPAQAHDFLSALKKALSTGGMRLERR